MSLVCLKHLRSVKYTVVINKNDVFILMMMRNK